MLRKVQFSRRGVEFAVAGPFPNLRSREIVKDIVDVVVEQIKRTGMTDEQSYWFTLGVVQGAGLSRDDYGIEAQRFILTLLDTFHKRGAPAVRELIKTVTGQELPSEAH